MQDGRIYRILYVDDEDDIGAIAQLSLQLDPTYEVKVRSSGRDALVEARTWHPDLVLLDMMMPDLDGPETLRQMRADPTTSSVPVLFVTGKSRREDVDRLLSLGAIGVISKPFNPMTLASQVKLYLGS